jgi:hypothetical protein
VDLAEWGGPVAVVIAGALNYLATRRVHEEVRSGNDKTSGQLNAITRGRQINQDIPAGQQTSDEKHYVEQYLEGRRREDGGPL